MPTQNYENHAQFVTVFHKVLLPVLLLTIVGAAVNVYESLGDHERMYSASLILVLSLCVSVAATYGRVFALKAQDRAIRAEENLRHFAITGKLLDARLSAKQIVGLRFASDGEFVALAGKAASEKLSPTDIKKAIRSWREDNYRV